MDALAIIAIIAGIVGTVAGIVQIVDYLQKRRGKHSTPLPAVIDQPLMPETVTTAGQNPLVQMREQINQYFSDGELKTLCFDLGLDYENLPGQTKADKARELVETMRRRNRLPELVQRCRELRPHVSWPDVLQELPPLPVTALPSTAIPHNLPQRSSFTGREAEKIQVHEALLEPDTYLISIDGIGGIGKSSLALAVAYDCLQASENQDGKATIARFAGFIWASARDRELTLNTLLDTIALTLDYPGIAQQPPDEKRNAADKLLRSGNYLLILDNFETVADETVRAFVRALPPPSKALITTREQNLYWTRAISLRGLSETEALTLIREEGRRLGLSAIARADGQLLRPLYQVTGGVPLAIRWAVGQIKQKGQSLDSVLSALSKARGDIFTEMFGRSWQLLSPEARRVLLTMPFFAAPAHREAIKAAAGLQGFTLDEALGQTVEMWLVEPTEDLEQTERRYSIHPLTRSFAREKLDENPAMEQTTWQNITRYYQNFADQNGGFWNFDGYARLEPELSNTLNIVRLALDHKQYELAVSLFLQVSEYMLVRGHWNEAMDYAAELLAAADANGHELPAARLRTSPIGWVHRHRGQLQLAKEETLKALSILEQSEDKRFTAYARRNLGRIYQELGDYDRAEQLLQQSLAYYREVDEEHHIYFLTANLAGVALEQGDLGIAWELCNGILPGIRRFEAPERIAYVLNIMGNVALQQGERDKAKDLWEEALFYMQRARRLDEIAIAQFNLAILQLEDGNLDTARRLLDDALETFQKLGMENRAQEVEQLFNQSLIVDKT